MGSFGLFMFMRDEHYQSWMVAMFGKNTVLFSSTISIGRRLLRKVRAGAGRPTFYRCTATLIYIFAT